VNAVQALKAARAAGIRLSIDGDALMLEAAAAPPASMLDLLSRHKAGIVALLRPVNGWSGADWLAFFDERAGIAEFDGGLPRAEAEARAFACCVVEWLNRNPVRSHPGRCLGCGGAERAHDPLLPFGTESGGHAWLHSGCSSAWHSARKADALAALAVMGISQPAINRDRNEDCDGAQAIGIGCNERGEIRKQNRDRGST
jgi:hypothetical protein